MLLNRKRLYFPATLVLLTLCRCQQMFDTLRYHEQYFDTQYGYCEFKQGDYVINPKSEKINLLPKPLLENDILNVLSSFPHFALHGTKLGIRNSKILSQYFGNIYEDFILIAPVLGPIFGEISSTLEYKLTSNSYSKEILLEYIKQSLDAFSEEVTIRLGSFNGGYVDDKVIELERDVLFKKVISLRNSWIDCGQYNDQSEINDCLNRKVIIADSEIPMFLVNIPEIFLVNKDNELSIHDIKRFEIHLPIFREFVFNYILFIESAIVSQRLLRSVESDEYFKAFTEKLITNVEIFQQYTMWAYEHIYKAHTKDHCSKTFKCNSFHDDLKVKQRYVNCSCAFDATAKSRVCTVQLKYMLNFLGESPSDGYKNSAKEILKDLNEKYTEAITEELKTFWQNEILEAVKSWGTVVKRAKESIH